MSSFNIIDLTESKEESVLDQVTPSKIAGPPLASVPVTSDYVQAVNNVQATNLQNLSSAKKDNSQTELTTKKRDYLTSTTPTQASHVTSSHATMITPSSEPAKKRRTNKKDLAPHVLLWICACGKNQSNVWTKKALRVIGIYATKEAAENKKQYLMSIHECCGHGDIIVGDTCWDEIDLVVRPVEEMELDL